MGTGATQLDWLSATQRLAPDTSVTPHPRSRCQRQMILTPWRHVNLTPRCCRLAASGWRSDDERRAGVVEVVVRPASIVVATVAGAEHLAGERPAR
jgi:hypothetical protein